jgi:adenylate cyclase
MSGDAEQEYFSDGITEDIITDLSKVSALWVAARNTVFTFKGKHVDVQQVARQLKVSHVLEGSVRKSGGRVRITAQLIDGASGGHVWAERYDRDLNDIFALQDEISEAIVKALKLKLLPAEKEAIERRGTTDPEAYKLYLMARQYLFTGNFGNRRRSEAIIRLCQRATEIDPNYAAAWAMMAAAQGVLRMFFSQEGDGGLAAAERALALDPNLAEALAARGDVRLRTGQMASAKVDIDAALRADPECYEAHSAAAAWFHAERRFAEAIPHYEKGTSLVATEYTCAGMAVSCHEALGDREGAARAARVSLARTEPIVANEPDNGSAISFVVGALAALGEVERAKAWMERATVLDPGNHNMQYNFACTLVMAFGDLEGGLEVLERIIPAASAEALTWVSKDPDMDRVRDHPRFVAAMAAARLRLGMA